MHLFQAMDVIQQSSDKMLWLFYAQLAESCYFKAANIFAAICLWFHSMILKVFFNQNDSMAQVSSKHPWLEVKMLFLRNQVTWAILMLVSAFLQ